MKNKIISLIGMITFFILNIIIATIFYDKGYVIVCTGILLVSTFGIIAGFLLLLLLIDQTRNDKNSSNG